MRLVLAIDTGNTQTKIGLFDQGGSLIQALVVPTTDVVDTAERLLQGWDADITIGWISTSREWHSEEWAALSSGRKLRILPVSPVTDWPFAQRYKTPETLGADRFAAIVAGCNLYPGRPVLVIDAGTAITYDLASQEPCYLGGAISPGIQMRYDALHHFTARLPRMQLGGAQSLIGDSTHNSLRAGVEGAVCKEVEGMIDAYREQFGSDLIVCLTGGDAGHFENQLKNINFADAFLVLRGIYFILKHIAST